ncbi:hypothetical protein NEOC65_001736 [Neochlamydia sp. AcF65]|nr:hypothetical protein [Neochlamydia sp. AcF65]
MKKLKKEGKLLKLVRIQPSLFLLLLKIKMIKINCPK